MSELSKALRERAEDSISQLRKAVAEFKNVCYANSLGSESVVLTDLIWGAVPQIDIFSIDTGRLYPETYDLIERLQQRYGRALTIYYPKTAALEGWVGENGINGFRAGLEQRRACCGIRKWNRFGARSRAQRLGHRNQARAIGQRALAAPVEWDGEYGLHKISPCSSGRKTRSGSTSARNACPTTPCMTVAFQASAARPAPARYNPAKMSARAAGGGSAMIHASADCIRAVR